MNSPPPTDSGWSIRSPAISSMGRRLSVDDPCARGPNGQNVVYDPPSGTCWPLTPWDPRGSVAPPFEDMSPLG